MTSQTDQFANTAESAVLPPASDEPASAASKAVPATRARLRMRQGLRQNRFVIIGAGALVIAFLLFVAVSVPRKKISQPAASQLGTTPSEIQPYDLHAEAHSLLPITNAAQPKQKLTKNGVVDEEAVERTATGLSTPSKPTRPSPAISQQSLASVPPFPEPWQAPPYSHHSELNHEVQEKSETDGL